MRLDGDPVWGHDQECSDARPCADCEAEEHARWDSELRDALVAGAVTVIAGLVLCFAFVLASY